MVQASVGVIGMNDLGRGGAPQFVALDG